MPKLTTPDGVKLFPAADRFELAIDGSQDVAAAYYRMDGDRFVLTHTIVPERFSGLGIGTRLAHGVFREIRKSGHQLVTVCSFMADFAARHPEYDDVVAEGTTQGEAS